MTDPTPPPSRLPDTLEEAHAEIIRLAALLELERLRFERYTATSVIVFRLFGVPTRQLLMGADYERALAALRERVTKFAEWEAHEQTITVARVGDHES